MFPDCVSPSQASGVLDRPCARATASAKAPVDECRPLTFPDLASAVSTQSISLARTELAVAGEGSEGWWSNQLS